MSNANDIMSTYWACACVKRDKDGKLKAIKLNPNSRFSCRVCGSRKPKTEKK